MKDAPPVVSATWKQKICPALWPGKKNYRVLQKSHSSAQRTEAKLPFKKSPGAPTTVTSLAGARRSNIGPRLRRPFTPPERVAQVGACLVRYPRNPQASIPRSFNRRKSKMTMPPSSSGGQAVLVYRCPTTHRQVKPGIETSTQALTRLGALKLSLWCPHCGSNRLRRRNRR
jgi:hypothetical protein